MISVDSCSCSDPSSSFSYCSWSERDMGWVSGLRENSATM